MYKSISIKNFRCFEDITIEPFKKINLITGLNNTGKTSLLEAIYLSLVPNDPEKLLTLLVLRELGGAIPLEADLLWGDLFFDRDYKKKKISISSKNMSDKKQYLNIYMSEEKSQGLPLPDKILFDTSERSAINKIEYQFTDYLGHKYFSSGTITGSEQNPVDYNRAKTPKKLKGFFASARHKWLKEDADKLGKLMVKRQEGKIVEILKAIEPRLKSLTVAPRSGKGIIHADIGMSELIPLPMMGGGINRLLSLAVAIPDNKDGIILIDEIDSGFHYTEMVNLWKGIQLLSDEYNVQIFSTTHSLECIRAAQQVFSETNNYDFTLHRLDINASGKISSVTYDQETLQTALEVGLEVR